MKHTEEYVNKINCFREHCTTLAHSIYNSITSETPNLKENNPNNGITKQAVNSFINCIADSFVHTDYRIIPSDESYANLIICGDRTSELRLTAMLEHSDISSGHFSFEITIPVAITDNDICGNCYSIKGAFFVKSNKPDRHNYAVDSFCRSFEFLDSAMDEASEFYNKWD